MTRAREIRSFPASASAVGLGALDSIPLDSREGIARLMAWAKAGGFVLNEYHAKLAEKHGVSVDGVTIAWPLPA